MPSRIFFGNPAAGGGASPINIALSPVVLEVVIPTMAPSYDQAIALSPVVLEVVITTPVKSTEINIALAPVVLEVVIPTMGVARHIALSPVVLEVVFTTPIITNYRSQVEGATAMFVHQADGSEVDGSPGPILEVAAWQTHRYLNRVGDWTAAISASQHPVAGRPLAQLIQRGWKVSLIQENNHPLDREDLEYLLYQGIVEDKEYSADESGQALCRLSGSFRALELVQRSTPTSAAYEAATIAAAATDIVGGMAGGITYPANASTETVTLTFNGGGDGVQSRFARLVKLGNYARYALRETWEKDALEFVRIDDPPDSGYVLVNQEMAGEGQEYAGAAGFALIGGSPLEVKREGRGIINRIIPFGATERRTYVDPASITNPPTLTMGVQPANGRLININGRGYIFTTGTPINGYIPIGATVADTRQSLIDAIAAADGINTSPHPQVRLGAFTGATAEFEFLGVPVTDFYVGGSYLNDAGNTWTEGELSEFAENVPLTLETATAAGPYTIYEGANPDGSAYWYIEDAASQARHGLIEAALHRSDVVNPSDDATTRAAAANVLYAIAAGTLIRQAAAKVYVTVPVANGAQVWALPGDKIKLQYVGNVELTEGVVTWEEFDKWFLVVERHDRSDPSGVRQVTFVLAAPEIEMTIPALPGAVILPITRGPEDSITTLLNELGLGDDTDLGGDGLGGETAPDCCDDPLEEIEDGPAPPEDIEFDDGTTPEALVWSLESITRDAGDPGPSWDINSMAYGAGVFVMGGIHGEIYTSADLLSWTLRANPADITFRAILGLAYANGVFIASCEHGPGTKPFMMYSTNGIDWDAATTPAAVSGVDGSKYEAAYGAGIWVTVGDGGPLYSTDNGETWQQSTGAPTSGLFSVAFGAGMFLAGGPTALYRSTDGMSWAAVAGESGAVEYGAGLFLKRGGGVIKKSTDGITWVEIATPPSAGASTDDPLAFSSGIWIYNDDGSKIYESTDNGDSWTLGYTAIDSETAYGVYALDGYFVGAGYDPAIAIASVPA